MAHLPQTTDAFAAGRLSYSQVGAITCVTTPDSKEGWVSAAVGAPGGCMDRAALGPLRASASEPIPSSAEIVGCR